MRRPRYYMLRDGLSTVTLTLAQTLPLPLPTLPVALA